MQSARLANFEDLEELVFLREQAFEDFNSKRGGSEYLAFEALSNFRHFETLKKAIDDSHYSVWVGIWDSYTVGYALVSYKTLEDNTNWGIIDEVYIQPAAREVGVGEALLSKVYSWCKQNGCKSIDAFALPGDRLTKNFFESFGFTARLIVLNHHLEV